MTTTLRNITIPGAAQYVRDFLTGQDPAQNPLPIPSTVNLSASIEANDVIIQVVTYWDGTPHTVEEL